MYGELKPGDRVGDYRVLELLGRGGMGAVYRAHDAARGRDVALKVFAVDGATDARALARFVREASAGSRVVHENLVAVLDAQTTGERPFLVMELAPGGSLASLVKRQGPLDARRAASVGAAVARGLAALHGAGFVHRDLKPANVLLDAEGRAKVGDLGLVGFTSSREAHLTRSGDMLGTPEYMAPEQLGERRSVSTATDLHGLGATLYFALTGEGPFRGEGAGLLVKVLKETPRPPSALAPSVPPELDALVLRLLSKGPRARGGSASEVARELDAIAQGAARSRRSGAPFVALSVALVALAAVGFFARPGRSVAPQPAPPVVAPPPSPPPKQPAARAGPSYDFEGDYYPDPEALVSEARDLVRRKDRARAYAAWARVVDSSDSSPAFLLEGRKALEDFAKDAPRNEDAALARVWSVTVVIAANLRQGATVGHFRSDDVSGLRGAVQAFEGAVSQISHGWVRIDSRVEVRDETVTSLTRADEGGFWPSPDDLRLDKHALGGSCETVIAFVPYGRAEGGVAKPPWRYGYWTDGRAFHYLVYMLHEGEAPPTPEALVWPWLNIAAKALRDVQSFPDVRVGNPESPETCCEPKSAGIERRLRHFAAGHVTDGMWRCLSARRQHTNAWTRGDIRQWRIARPEPFTGSTGSGLAQVSRRALTSDVAAVEQPTARIELQTLFPELGQGDLATLAETWVRAPRATRALLTLAWDDGIDVMLGETPVFHGEGPRGLDDKKETWPLELTTEWQPLVVRIENTGGPWGFHLRLRGEDGNPLRGLEIRASKGRPK